MGRTSDRKGVATRIFRPGEPVPLDWEWENTTPEQRIEAVWQLTLLCLRLDKDQPGEPRLRDLLAEFNEHGVEYLLVGAYALAAHGHVRATEDLDVWIRPARDNAAKVLRALKAFGAPLHDLTETDLTKPGLVFQIGLPPVRIDLLTALEGVEFGEAWLGRMQIQFADQPVSVMSREHLIRNKRAAGRTQDLADVERLESNQKERP